MRAWAPDHTSSVKEKRESKRTYGCRPRATESLGPPLPDRGEERSIRRGRVQRGKRKTWRRGRKEKQREAL